eukprot:CAMPEP_0176357082 /NCGR_PEP_ID=MMETSP0126-20121128/14510_1 /TAXON_ID=141414 ORGANISM="Strombidinopsis acuminatum, Strain SPMC142" /NCGR_SAMPLE_ID=MMETSP0126 /ASSEMBLY_ACC=CAM_ASM_000229 /LENGTH=129 /DNA_ID=CAMNT_0017710519 /DNA_START=122 /DNA_END=511 /DNA_ORIENTATION=+
MDDYSFHDKVSSYECGSSLSFDMCNDVWGSCESKHGSTGAGHVRTSKVGHNDTLDRLFLRYYDPAVQGAVVAFRDSDCRSDSGRFLSSTTSTASYTKSMMDTRNMKNDAISSIMIPEGYSVRLFVDDNF